MASASERRLSERATCGLEQGIESLQYRDVLNVLLADTSTTPLPHYLSFDPREYQDGAEIKFSRSQSSGKVPQIRHASVERLLSRLVDLRPAQNNAEFLSTFLLTYRVYTDGAAVLGALARLHRHPDSCLEPPGPRGGDSRQLSGSQDAQHKIFHPFSTVPSPPPSTSRSSAPPPRQGSAPVGASTPLSESYPPQPRGGQPMGRLLRRLSTGGEGAGEKGGRGARAGEEGVNCATNQGLSCALRWEDRRHSVNESTSHEECNGCGQAASDSRFNFTKSKPKPEPKPKPKVKLNPSNTALSGISTPSQAVKNNSSFSSQSRPVTEDRHLINSQVTASVLSVGTYSTSCSYCPLVGISLPNTSHSSLASSTCSHSPSGGINYFSPPTPSSGSCHSAQYSSHSAQHSSHSVQHSSHSAQHSSHSAQHSSHSASPPAHFRCTHLSSPPTHLKSTYCAGTHSTTLSVRCGASKAPSSHPCSHKHLLLVPAEGSTLSSQTLPHSIASTPLPPRLVPSTTFSSSKTNSPRQLPGFNHSSTSSPTPNTHTLLTHSLSAQRFHHPPHPTTPPTPPPLSGKLAPIASCETLFDFPDAAIVDQSCASIGRGVDQLDSPDAPPRSSIPLRNTTSDVITPSSVTSSKSIPFCSISSQSCDVKANCYPICVQEVADRRKEADWDCTEGIDYIDASLARPTAFELVNSASEDLARSQTIRSGCKISINRSSSKTSELQKSLESQTKVTAVDRSATGSITDRSPRGSIPDRSATGSLSSVEHSEHFLSSSWEFLDASTNTWTEKKSSAGETRGVLQENLGLPEKDQKNGRLGLKKCSNFNNNGASRGQQSANEGGSFVPRRSTSPASMLNPRGVPSAPLILGGNSGEDEELGGAGGDSPPGGGSVTGLGYDAVVHRASSPVIFGNAVNFALLIQNSEHRVLQDSASSSAQCYSSPAAASNSLQVNAENGMTSSRMSKRRSSSAAAGYDVISTGSSNQNEPLIATNQAGPTTGSAEEVERSEKCESCLLMSAANMRVLAVLKHWIAKHPQDFESSAALMEGAGTLLEDMAFSPTSLSSHQPLALALLHVLGRLRAGGAGGPGGVRVAGGAGKSRVNLDRLLAPPKQDPQLQRPKDLFDQFSAFEIAEQMTFLDHQIFISIRSEELLGQAWMKADKATRAAHVLLVSKRFNEASRLVVSEIVRRANTTERAACIEKWAAVADICRLLRNYNGVLQICAAFVNSSIYRLRKTWERISKQSKQLISKLQTLVSSDGRFKNMRDALRTCEPPCIPYLGMYLTDLSFIEEGTPTTTDEGLVNFAKMRMIGLVISEIQRYQSTPYTIEYQRRVASYLLDTSQLLEEDDTYRSSLEMEPRTSRSSIGQLGQPS